MVKQELIEDPVAWDQTLKANFEKVDL